MNSKLYAEIINFMRDVKVEGGEFSDRADELQRKLMSHEHYPYRWDGRKHLADYDLYLEATDQLDAHDPNTGDDPIWAERLDLEYDEEVGKYLNPYKDGVLR